MGKMTIFDKKFELCQFFTKCQPDPPFKATVNYVFSSIHTHVNTCKTKKHTKH